MYKLLMLGALIGVGVAIAKSIKRNKIENNEKVQTQEKPAVS